MPISESARKVAGLPGFHHHFGTDAVAEQAKEAQLRSSGITVRAQSKAHAQRNRRGMFTPSQRDAAGKEHAPNSLCRATRAPHTDHAKEGECTSVPLWLRLLFGSQAQYAMDDQRH
jgi:hypothetical protein